MDIAREFEQTALPHLDAVYRAAYALCGQRAQAEDLAQTAFLKALQQFASFTPGTNCKAWLVQIVRNTWFDELRRRKVLGTVLPVEEQVVAEPERPVATVWSNAEDLLENFSDEEVLEALADLSPDQRLTLFLVDVEEFDQDQVAEITGVAVGTVKSRACRARAALKIRLAEYARDKGWLERTRESSDK
jgi:RNA polymerase sigma-70 factor (ECF subfamily)